MTGLARSTYYYKPKVDPKIRVQQDLDLRDRIEAIQAEFPGVRLSTGGGGTAAAGRSGQYEARA